MKERFLVIAHAHPDFKKGGGELAAWYLCQKYRLDGHEAVFLGCIDHGYYPSGEICMRREHDYTWEQAADILTLQTQNLNSLYTNFADFVRAVRPTCIHLHHYLGVGLETFFALKRIVPDVPLWLTLHEYAAICPHDGQMVKTGSMELCYRSSPAECQLCMTDCTVEMLWVRRYHVLQTFRLVDRFISPSHFLKQRYVEWGLDAERISVEENWLPPMEKLPPRPLAEGESRNRFGFFGQFTQYKGIDVLLESLLQLPKEQRKKIVLEVNGAGLELQPKTFQNKINRLRKTLEMEGIVQWRGPYQREQLRQRMSSIDWVVVPSIWWENSPLVIQEALGFGRPVLVSDLGGMAEKVKDSFHIPNGDICQWALALSSLSSLQLIPRL